MFGIIQYAKSFEQSSSRYQNQQSRVTQKHFRQYDFYTPTSPTAADVFRQLSS